MNKEVEVKENKAENEKKEIPSIVNKEALSEHSKENGQLESVSSLPIRVFK